MFLCVAAWLAVQSVGFAGTLRPVEGTVVELREHRRGQATIVRARSGPDQIEAHLEGLSGSERMEVGTVLTVFCGMDDGTARCLASPAISWIGAGFAALIGLIQVGLGRFFIVRLRRALP